MTYQLVIEVPHPLCIAVGALGERRFPAGRYIYTGSARRALEARIARHLHGAARLHWHVDYLLATPGVRVLTVRRSPQTECAANAAVAGEVVVAGFGASDCRAGCSAHLKRVSGPRRRRP
jgi:Uri superfamily endonuclease